MNDYILLMHADATEPQIEDAWPTYFAKLKAAGIFDGGSSIGAGEIMRKDTISQAISGSLAGFIRVRAGSLEAAKRLVEGNPLFEAGGSVEVRELPRD